MILATDEVAPRALRGMLAAMVVRSLEDSGTHDQLSVLMTSMRDALSAGG